MSDNARRSFNPNAPSFVPNAGAAPFVPGQAYAQPPPTQPPPPHPMVPSFGGGGGGGGGGGQPPAFGAPPPGGRPMPPMFGGGGGGAHQVFPQMHQQHGQGGELTRTWQAAPPPLVQPAAVNCHQPIIVQQQPSMEAGEEEAWDAEKEEATQPPACARAITPPSTDNPQPTAGDIRPPAAATAAAEDTDEGSEGERFSSAAAANASADVGAMTAKFKSTAVIDDNRKERVNMVFVGHVDAGKSTIGGQIMYLTGMVDKRTLEKYEREAKEKGRESWYLSWALDTNDEERDKGKTVEVGRAFFETEQKHFTILDAPGHKSFVPNMIAGTNQADVAVLVISARKGEFETGFDRGGQTREHAMLVKTAGVKHMIILVNKMDDPTVNWEEERFAEIQDKLTPYLRRCGFNPKTDIAYIPCSGLSGAFIKERPSDGVCPWYSGPCFLEYVDTMLPKFDRDFEGTVRAIIVDKCSDMGTVVSGKVLSGVIVRGQNALLMPNRTNVQILQCWANDAETDQVYSGDNFRIKLKGVEDSDILAGFVLCSPEAPCKTGRIFDAEVLIYDYKSIISAGYSCVLHIHTSVEEVTVKRIICTMDKKTNEKKLAKFVKQDDKCIIRLESAEAFCLEPFNDFPQMGRFTLRDEGKTIAMGKVVKIVE